MSARTYALAALLLIQLITSVRASNEGNAFEGVVNATMVSGGSNTAKLVFTRKANLLRIENTTNKLEAINIIDLAAKQLMIVFPHNTTFMRLEMSKLETPQQASDASPSTRMASSVPPMSTMAAMTSAPALIKTDKTKKLQNRDCTLYHIDDGADTFEIWATNDSELFPFYLIRRNPIAQRFGPQMLEQRWVELLREQSLFPLEAKLKTQTGGQERFTFTVNNIDKIRVGGDSHLFSPPKNYIEIQAPQF